MRDMEPPLSPPSPAPATAPSLAPSRLRRTLHSLRSPFRSGSPFHIGSIKRSGSTKTSASDGDNARDERTMRKKIKKQRADASSDASRSTDSSPSVDKKKKESASFIRRMGTIGKKRAEESTPTPPKLEDSSPSTSQTEKCKHPPPQLEDTTPPPPQSDNTSPPPSQLEVTPPPPPQLEELKSDSNGENKNNSPNDKKHTVSVSNPLTSSPEPVSPIAVEHAVATRPFTKDAWKRKIKPPEIPKPVEEPSPGNAFKRRIETSACLSDDHDEDDDDDDDDEGAVGSGGEVGSLEEAVALARVRLGAGAHSPSPPHSRDYNETEEEGSADTMPAYGDLIEPENKAGNGSGPSHATPSAERREHLYKILVIGELGTGKTSIIKRYVHQFFSQHYRATIGVDFALKVLNWDSNTIIRLQLWDIAGQERFGNMTRVYYKEAVGAFIVFDVSRVATFDAVVKWKNDLDTKVQLPDGSPIPCILLANKCDQQKEGIVNSPAKMDEYCREKGFAGWFETSAKENINIEEAARSLVNKILLNDKLLHNNDKDGEKFALDHKIANGENSRNGGGSGKSCAC
ncbi:unnamed protein product [Parnassius mnemosyne]|uniref:Ras-related protein Rab-32 n=1 Tax=Parnassius mnemosyne TaxID=213953 RepID=A0AAV1M1T2_9NEOP